LKLNLTYQSFAEIIGGEEQIKESQAKVDVVHYDTRLISRDQNGVFFALKGHKNGHQYVQAAYEKGVRLFVISEKVDLPKDASTIKVDTVLSALQQLAKYHRSRYSYPVLAITGSVGKTTIKEWLYYLIKDHFSVVRSPKSFNSQLGVALSLLELDDDANFAIIEADISKPGEMDALEDMIAPTLGIYTGVGKFYADNFNSQKEHHAEHLKLFKHANICFALEELASPLRRNKINADLTTIDQWKAFGIDDFTFPKNAALVLHVADFLGIHNKELKEKVLELPVLPNRMEVFEGQNGNLIINDTYNIDVDALEQALNYQFSSNERQDKVVVIDVSYVDEDKRKNTIEVVSSFNPKKVFILDEQHPLPEEVYGLKDASILFKGSFRSNLSTLVQRFKNRKHETWVEFSLKAIQHNIDVYRSKVPETTKILVMVKASSYGTGDVNIPHFLQQIGVDYLGVAYTDEGTTLRERGVSLPILIMNTELNAFDDIVNFCLEPSIFSIEQLYAFINYLDSKNMDNYPIHLTFETGMNRLGFYPEDVDQILKIVQSTNAVRIKSIYSHLADADNQDTTFTKSQIERFKAIRQSFIETIEQPIIFHILNSEGASIFGKDAAFDMVRLGIGVFGYTSRAEKDELLPCLKWKTTISQIKTIQPGETVGYGRTYKAKQQIKIATLRVGYADGFRRSLSNGVGEVFINGKRCPVVGNACMDMTMVDVSLVDCKPGDEVEIIGENITMEAFSNKLGTIPYEVMTSINKRVARLYIK
jgi:alanine racemase